MPQHWLAAKVLANQYSGLSKYKISKKTSVDMISNEEKRNIEIARKYGLVPGTMKCKAFGLFDDNYSARKVRYLLRNYKVDTTNQTFTNTIRRYYNLWKEKNKVFTNK